MFKGYKDYFGSTFNFFVCMFATFIAFAILFPFIWATIVYFIPALGVQYNATESNPPRSYPTAISTLVSPEIQTQIASLPDGLRPDQLEQGKWYAFGPDSESYMIRGRWWPQQQMFQLIGTDERGIAIEIDKHDNPENKRIYAMLANSSELIADQSYYICDQPSSHTYWRHSVTDQGTELTGCLLVIYKGTDSGFFAFTVDGVYTLFSNVSHNMYPAYKPIQ